MRDGNAVAATDEALIQRTREGDRSAFAELWQRHYRAGLAAARAFSSIDSDDLVSEAFTRIYKRTIDGGGPRGAFRPYLYTTVRNIASTWGSANARVVDVEDVDDLAPTESAEEPVGRMVDRDLTIKAYESLPQRWKTVLWYTEVEGLDPAEVAPILGMTANGVAALSYRAREGLRKAWLQAHVSSTGTTPDCAWTIGRLGERSRHSLSTRDSRKVEAHLRGCATCSSMSVEVEEVGSRLAMAYIPFIGAGVVGTGILVGSTSTGGAAVAAMVPALPAAITGGTAAASGISAGIAAVAASVIVVAAAGVGVAVATQQPATAEVLSASTSEPVDTTAPVDAVVETPASVDPATVPDVLPTAETVPTSAPAATDISTTTTASETTTTSTDTATPATTDASKPKKKGLDDVVTTTTDTVNSVVAGTSDTLSGTVDGVTDVVDGVVDAVLPGVDGTLGGTLNGTVDGVTGLVDGVTGGVTDTLTGTVGGVTDLVGALIGGKKKG